MDGDVEQQPTKRPRVSLCPSLAMALNMKLGRDERPCERVKSKNSMILPPAKTEEDAARPVAHENIVEGSLVLFKNMQAYKAELASLDGQIGIVTRINVVGAQTIYEVSESSRQRLLELSAHFLSLRRTYPKTERTMLKTADVVVTVYGFGVIAGVTATTAEVQLDSTSQVVKVEITELTVSNAESTRLPPPVLSLLLQHQSTAADFICRRKETMCIVPMGGGKTMIGLASLARCLSGLRDDTNVYHSDVGIVMCPVSLISDVWLMAIRRLTCFESRTWVYIPKQSLPQWASVILISYHATLSEAELKLLLNGRFLKVAIAEECAELRNGGAHFQMAKMVMRMAHCRIGMAGIPVSTEVKQMANQCELLCYSSKYTCTRFWEQENALTIMRKNGELLWLESATITKSIKSHPVLREGVPKHYPDAKVKYEPCDGHFKQGCRIFTDYVVGCFQENWEVNEKMARYLADKSNLEEMKARSLIVRETMPKSKLAILVDVLVRIMSGQRIQGIVDQQELHRKFVIAAVFMSSLDALQHVIKITVPELEQFRYDGGLSFSERSTNLQNFMATTNRSVLFLGAASGGLGLSITAASCMIAWELPGSDMEWRQLRGRVVRTGNQHKVQVITFSGPVQAARESLHEDHREVANKLGLSLA